jgi:hypothetical protein
MLRHGHEGQCKSELRQSRNILNAQTIRLPLLFMIHHHSLGAPVFLRRFTRIAGSWSCSSRRYHRGENIQDAGVDGINLSCISCVTAPRLQISVGAARYSG